MHLQKMPWAKIFLSSWPNTSWTLLTESTRHQIWLWCICWLCTVVNSYIEIEFDVNYSFAPYNKDSSVFVLGAAHCQQIQIHQKFNIKLNSTFGTFSGIGPRPINKAQSPFAPDCFLYKLDITKATQLRLILCSIPEFYSDFRTLILLYYYVICTVIISVRWWPKDIFASTTLRVKND